MTTDIPNGAYFRFRYRGQYDYGKVKGHLYSLLLHDDIPVGSQVHNAVWKGHNRLESRGTYTHKGKRKGDRERVN